MTQEAPEGKLRRPLFSEPSGAANSLSWRCSLEAACLASSALFIGLFSSGLFIPLLLVGVLFPAALTPEVSRQGIGRPGGAASSERRIEGEEIAADGSSTRSEERRVGKECRSRW